MFPFSRDFYFVSFHLCLSIFKAKDIYLQSKKYLSLKQKISILKAKNIFP